MICKIQCLEKRGGYIILAFPPPSNKRYHSPEKRIMLCQFSNLVIPTKKTANPVVQKFTNSQVGFEFLKKHFRIWRHGELDDEAINVRGSSFIFQAEIMTSQTCDLNELS